MIKVMQLELLKRIGTRKRIRSKQSGLELLLGLTLHYIACETSAAEKIYPFV